MSDFGSLKWVGSDSSHPDLAEWRRQIFFVCLFVFVFVFVFK